MNTGAYQEGGPDGVMAGWKDSLALQRLSSKEQSLTAAD